MTELKFTASAAIPPDTLATLFGGGVCAAPQVREVRIYSRRPGKAGLTNTQRHLARHHGPERPPWLWRLRRERACWTKSYTLTHVIPRATVESR